MKVRVSIEGYGVFQIENNKIPELISWLSRNEGISINENKKVMEIKNNQFTGRELINEGN